MITLTLTVLTWATQTPLALAFGAWAAGPQRIRAVVSTIFFLPLLLSTAAIALIWQALLDPTFGLPAQWSELTGLSANVLGDPDLALWAIVFVLLWQFLPFHMLLYQRPPSRSPRRCMRQPKSTEPARCSASGASPCRNCGTPSSPPQCS